jgi:hypothetical protein
VLALAALGPAGLDGQGVVRLAPDSPLATAGTVLFAVAEDGRTLVTRALAGSSPWVPVALAPAPQSIGGLAADREALYLADTAGAALYRVALARGMPSGALTPLHQGAPLRRPRELALARLLLVADDETHDVHGVPPGGGSLSRVERLSRLSPEPIHLAGSEDPSEGHVLVSVRGPAPGVLEARLAGAEAIFLRPLLQVQAGAAGRSPQQPGALALRSGIVYLADQADGALYAFSRESGSAVRIVRTDATGEHQGRSSRVVVTTNEILELDASTGTVVRRPRLVPAELVLQTESLSETLALWYTYLHEKGILPTREVPHSRNVEATLRAQEALLAPYVRRLDPLMCALNPTHCVRGVLRPLREGEPLRIPDLPFERFTNLRSITLDGKTTLGQRVDELVSSDALASWRSEETLRKLNPKDATVGQLANPMAQVAAGETLRSRRTGSYVVPVEAIRYLAAVQAIDIPPAESALGRITRFRGASIRSLEERRASASAATQPPPSSTPRVDDLRAAFEALTAGWSEDLWLPEPVLIRPHVAVVEEFVNRDNPVFMDQEDDAFALDRSGMPQPASVTPPAGAGLVVRAADKADHGTGVAWLIAGRRSAFGPGGLAPSALLFHLPNVLDDLVRKLPEAVAQHNVHVVNISAYWKNDIPSDGLSRAINNFSDSALFVVAAGNNLTTGPDGEVCEAFLAFPACWGDRKNVVVVTATNRERSGLLAPVVDVAGVVTEPGANWNATAVHVAAPGEGYYVPGANGDYVPARGSSFATPLVTATAALLYAQGVQRPSLIKQRILATADPVAGLAGRVKAGVLNFRRALGHPFVTVVTSPDGEKLPLVVVPGQEIEVATSTGQRRRLPLDSVRRLHKHGTVGLWRIVYATGATLDALEIEEDVDFTDEVHSEFRFFPLKQVVVTGAETRRYWVSQAERALEGKLVDYVDFVGPAIPPGR